MAGHTQQPSEHGNPSPAASPSPVPGPVPGASERVALKKEIGLLSACTIIIGERDPGGRAPGGRRPNEGRRLSGSSDGSAWGTCGLASESATTAGRAGAAGPGCQSCVFPPPCRLHLDSILLRGFCKAVTLSFLICEMAMTAVLQLAQELDQCRGWSGCGRLSSPSSELWVSLSTYCGQGPGATQCSDLFLESRRACE